MISLALKLAEIVSRDGAMKDSVTFLPPTVIVPILDTTELVKTRKAFFFTIERCQEKRGLVVMITSTDQ